MSNSGLGPFQLCVSWARISELEIFISKMGIIILSLPRFIERFKGAICMKALSTYE